MLRTARERRNLSLEQLAHTTKVSTTLLQAIEDNAFHKVPAGIFIRGYLSAYAREVGLDAGDILNRYHAQTGTALDAAAAGAPGEAVRSPTGDVRTSRVEIGAPKADVSVWAYIVVTGLVLAAFVSYTRSTGPDEGVPFDSPVAGAAGAPDAADAVLESATPGAADDPSIAQPIGTGSALLRLEIEPRGPCWVEVTADGTTAIYRLMQAGERELVEAQREMSLRVGDPAACAFSINGRPGRELGRAGVPATVRLTADTYQDLWR